MDITFSETIIIEFPPIFTTELDDITIDISNISTSFEYYFPLIFDPNNDTFDMRIIGLPEFLLFSELDNSLSMIAKSNLTFEDVGNYTVGI